MSKIQYTEEVANSYKKSKQSLFRTEIERFTLIDLLLNYANTNGTKLKGSVLDLACGDGIYSRMVTQLGASRVVGVDNSAQMIHLAREEESTNPLGCEYIEEDVINLQLDEKFDVVLASYLFNYAQSERELFDMAEVVANHLKPGGVLLGINDNIFATSMYIQNNYIQDLQLKYGIYKSVQNKIPGFISPGDPISYSIYNDDGSIVEFNNFYLSPHTYQRVFEGQVDMVFKFKPVIASTQKEYWDDFFLLPPVIGFVAKFK